MPWTGKQTRLFRGIAHGNIPPKKGLSVEGAKELLRHAKKRRKHGRASGR